jgi:hypothetical protein
MRTGIAFLFFLLAGTAFAQQDLKSYPADARTTDAPTFVNAEVVRVNRDNTATFRSESGEITLTADDSAPGMLGSLHAGDKVLVEYREVKGAGGRVTRYVTSVKSASPTSGEPGRASVVPARLTAGSTVRARVLSFDKSKRRVTVVDESGGLRTLPVGSRVSGLDALVPGSNVSFGLGAGTGGAVNVSGITPLGNTPVFANNNAFPPINGQFVNFNPKTGQVTIDTTTGGRVTFPVASNVAGGSANVRRGDNLSFGFDIAGANPQLSTSTTTATPQLSTSSFTAAPVATINAFQPLTTVGGAAGVLPGVGATGGNVPGAVPGAVPGVVPGQPVVGATTTSGNTVGGFAVGTPGAAAVPGQAGVQGQAGVSGQAAPAGGNTVGGFAVGAGTGATGGTGANTGGTVGGGVVGGTVGGTPLGNPVPSIPSATPVAGVVLPPAGAKDPLSAEDVGLMRAQGERDLDAAAVALASAAAGIDPLWAGFKNQCLSGFTVNTVTSGREWYLLADDRIPTPTDDGCRALHADLTGRARGFLAQIQVVEDAARKADVLPVRVREVLDRHKLR